MAYGRVGGYLEIQRTLINLKVFRVVGIGVQGKAYGSNCCAQRDGID